jgi:4-amino-4-deoxy-L-arabinose transferase-like glycosyltransferase
MGNRNAVPHYGCSYAILSATIARRCCFCCASRFICPDCPPFRRSIATRPISLRRHARCWPAATSFRPRYLDQNRYRKPIGIYWLQAAAVKAVGGGDAGVIWPYRLPSAAGMTMAVLLTYWIGALIFDRAIGTLAGALLAASVLAVVQANLARADAALLACIVAAQACLAALYTGVLPRRRKAFLAAGFWAALGAGILIKGPVAPFVSGSTILMLALTDRYGAPSAADGGQKSRWLADLRWLPGMLLVIAIIAPWGLSVGRATGWDFYSAASRDFLPKLRAGVESHWGLPGYYLILALVTFYPGSLVLLTAAHSAWRRWTSSPAQRFCLAWLLPTWIACEFIPTKLPHYVLPSIRPWHCSSHRRCAPAKE